MSHSGHEPLVGEAIGPPLTPGETIGALGVGVNSLIVGGVLSVLLGSLADEHRLSFAGIGQAAMVEILTVGLVTALVGGILKPRRLKLIGVLASLVLAIADLATAKASGGGILLLRGIAGVSEGVLLWIAVSMISRTATPERWAGVFYMAQTAGQLVMAIVLAVWVLPRFGATGGFTALAISAAIGLIPAFMAPSSMADLNPGEAIAGPPPARGWIALIATVIYVAGSGAVAVYLQPLAHQAGLGADVARTAVWVALAAQVAGSTAATVLAGKVRWFVVFLAVSAAYLLVWWLYDRQIPAWLFIAAAATSGLFGYFLGPFLVPMTIEADPSRRAAVQSGAAQVLGAALGPALASAVVSAHDVRGVLWLALALMLTGLAGVAWLHFTDRTPLATAGATP